jgi:hypothetical protein
LQEFTNNLYNADIEVNILANVREVSSNGILAYNTIITNGGTSSAKSIRITEVLPDGKNVQHTVPLFNPSESTSFIDNFVVRPGLEDPELVNKVTVDSEDLLGNPDDNLSNNIDSVSVRQTG